MVCPHLEAYIDTDDGKFLCFQERYEKSPTIPDNTEILECTHQFFPEFTDETFINKSNLTSINIAVGRLAILRGDTLKGAKSLLSFNASRCLLRGEIPEETLCKQTPDIRQIDFSHNRNYVFTSKPFECLEHLTELRINDTIQKCDPDTVRWIEGLPPGTIIGNECVPPTSGKALHYFF